MPGKPKAIEHVNNFAGNSDTEQKLRGVNIDIDALRKAVSSIDGTHTQTLSLIGRMRDDLAIEQAKVHRLELQMDEILKHLKPSASAGR